MKFPILSILFWWISVVHAAVTLRQSSGRAERVLAAKRGVSSQTFSGTGTWFIPSTEGGSTGACGNYNADDAMIVALVSIFLLPFCLSFLQKVTNMEDYRTLISMVILRPRATGAVKRSKSLQEANPLRPPSPTLVQAAAMAT